MNSENKIVGSFAWLILGMFLVVLLLASNLGLGLAILLANLFAYGLVEYIAEKVKTLRRAAWRESVLDVHFQPLLLKALEVSECHPGLENAVRVAVKLCNSSEEAWLQVRAKCPEAARQIESGFVNHEKPQQ